MLQRAKRLLLIDDPDGRGQNIIRSAASLDEVEVLTASDQKEAIAAMRRYRPDVLLRWHSGEDGGRDIREIQELIRLAPNSRLLSVGPDVTESAARIFEAGALDVLSSGVSDEDLRAGLERAFRAVLLEAIVRIRSNEEAPDLEGIVASSEKMLKVCRTVRKVAPIDVTTLLLGESGTGKELIARALHAMSPRAEGNFVAINCAAIPENLLESELFGYEKGAFTGANRQTPGKIEQSHQGTLFLDEIGDMPLSLQAKLLRFMQERVLERVGGRIEIPVDVRVISATNQDLAQLISENRFREDLYYRISEISISIPPLRERDGEQLVLARHFLEKFSNQHRRKTAGLTSDAEDAIQSYDWPGNVREMENRMKSAVVMAEGSMLSAEDLGLDSDLWQPESLDLRAVRRNAETKAIRLALIQTYGNISRAAELLGITRPTLYDLLDKYGITADGFARKKSG